jgi:ABC-type bacteriocin/lantibiotic exporter with double-glycine peptidase domain
MKSKDVKSFDPLLLSYWKNWLISTLICLVAGITVLTCSQWATVAALSFTLLYVIMMAPAEYKLYQKTQHQALENSWKNGMS